MAEVRVTARVADPTDVDQVVAEVIKQLHAVVMHSYRLGQEVEDLQDEAHEVLGLVADHLVVPGSHSEELYRRYWPENPLAGDARTPS